MKITVTTTSQTLEEILAGDAGNQALAQEAFDKGYKRINLYNGGSVSIYYENSGDSTLTEGREIQPDEELEEIDTRYIRDVNLISDTSNNEDIILIFN